MKNMQEITAFLEGKINDLVCVRRIVNSGKFRIVLADASESSLKELDDILRSLDTRRLNKWVEGSEELGNTGIRRLREIAQELGVYRYSKLPKAVLLIEIRRMQSARRNFASGSDVTQ